MLNFESLNHFNVFINSLSGNSLPLSSTGIQISMVQRLYTTLAWLITISSFVIIVSSAFYVPKEKALQNSTVTIVITAEVILLLGYLHANKNLLRGLIGKLDYLLAVRNEALSSAVISALQPIEKPLRIYTIVLLSSVIFWTTLPLIKVWQKNDFYYEDYAIPAKFSSEPFSTTIFIAGVFFETVASFYAILKKVGIDIYTIYLIRLVTSQYRYVRTRLTSILQQKNKTIDSTLSNMQEIFVRAELKKLVHHHAVVLEISTMLKQLLSFNVGLIYMENVFRFCFMGFMIITSPPDYFEKTLLIMYTLSAVVQLLILCNCAEQLLEASVRVTDDAFYEEWYANDNSVPRVLSFLIFANNLECKLSAFGNMNLTVASVASILNQAYSACLLILKVK